MNVIHFVSKEDNVICIIERMASRTKYKREQLPLELGNTDGILERWGDQVEKNV